MATVEQSVASPALPGDLVQTMLDCRVDLLAFLSRRLRCRATAEDIAQDVFLRLIKSPISSQHPRGLIFRTAVNLASNHVRDERRRAVIREHDFLPLQLRVEERTPERLAIGRQGLRQLSLEIASWPTRTREIFILNRCDGLTQREIGARLRISSTAIERHMARAILNLSAWALRIDDACYSTE